MSLGGYQDPGWWSSVRHMVTMGLVKPRVVDGVVMTRMLFLSLVSAGLLIGLVLTWIMPFGSPSPGLGTLVVALGAAGAAASFVVSRRPLDASSAQSLAGSYRTSFFLAFALTEASLLVAFVICFVVTDERSWPFFVALPLYLVGMSFIAPTRGNLERRQRQVTGSGSMLSLVDALNAPPSGEPTPQ